MFGRRSLQRINGRRSSITLVPLLEHAPTLAMRTILFMLCCSLIHAVAGQGLFTFTHDGILRQYNLYVPTTYSPLTEVPLVFVLHGTTQTGEGIMDISDFNTVAEANGFIAAYPWGIGGSWNTGLPGASTANDLELIDTIATIIEQQYAIDPLRIFSCGLSAGGYMSYRLACESPRCFAAVASVAGTMTDAAYNACAPTFPANVLHIHGTSDFVVNYNGAGLTGKSVDEVLALWNDWNGCDTVPLVTALPNTVPLDFSTVEHHDYSPCSQGAVELLKVIGGGHQWPGTSNLLGGLGIINQDIDASEEIWDFFSQHTCAGLSTSVSSTEAVQQPVPRWLNGEWVIDWSGSPTTYELSDVQGRHWGSGILQTGANAVATSTTSKGILFVRIRGGEVLRLIVH